MVEIGGWVKAKGHVTVGDSAPFECTGGIWEVHQTYTVDAIQHSTLREQIICSLAQATTDGIHVKAAWPETDIRAALNEFMAEQGWEG